MILPVPVEMTMVAEVSRPSTTALEDASTVMFVVVIGIGIVAEGSSMECGVSVPVAKGAMFGYDVLCPSSGCAVVLQTGVVGVS